MEETAAETSCLTCSGSSGFEILGQKPELVLKLEARFTKLTYKSFFKVMESSFFFTLFIENPPKNMLFWRRG